MNRSKRIHVFLRSLSALAVLLIAQNGAWAQNAAARIVGNLTDPNGASVPSAKITVVNADTQVHYDTTANNEGYFQANDLPIGRYNVTVEAPGFRKITFQNQLLQINQVLRMDAKLEIGSVAEVIEVKDQVNIIETVNPTVGDSVTGRALTNMPLNGRNALDLALLQPGVTPQNPDDGSAGTFNIAGGRSDSVTFLMDGGLNNDLLDNSVTFNPNPDTIAEFRILKSDYTAEYGRNAGGIISVVTKSGTNQWHGSGFDFVRNDDFNANSFFNKNDATNLQPRNVLKRHQYGGTFGGPITIPHLVHGKDRFFFFVGYQGQRQSTKDTSVSPVFKPLEIQGNFSQSGNQGTPGPAACPNRDPFVAQFLATNPFFVGTAGNAACATMDPARINGVAQKYIAAGFLPTSTTGILNSQGTSTDNRNELTMKFDFNITDRDKLSVTLGGRRIPTLNGFDGGTVPGFPDSGTNNEYFSNFAYLKNFSPNILNELRAVVQRAYTLQAQPARKQPTPAALGVINTPDIVSGPPVIAFDNGLNAGFSIQGPSRLINNTFAYSDTLTWIRGNHTLKFGGGWSDYQFNTVFAFFVDGEFDFSATSGNSGNSFADFLLGLPADYQQSPAAPTYARSQFTHGFAQDEWRLKKNLTLTLGLRYEYGSPRTDKQGHTFSYVPGQQSTKFHDCTPVATCTNVPRGFTFPGDPNTPRGLNYPDRNDFAPRVGFAWDPRGNGKTSIRGGFGVFYDILKAEDVFQQNGQPPWFSGVAQFFPALSANPTTDVPFLSNPYPNLVVPVPPGFFPSHVPPSNVDFSPFLPIGNAPAFVFVDPHLRTPYTYQYNLSLQREVARNTRVEISYVGSSSHGLTSLIDINPFKLGTDSRIQNLLPGTSNCSFDENTSNLIGSCSYGGMFTFKNLSKSSFNSLEAGLTRQLTDSRFIGATYFTLGYTYAHSIDNTSGFRNRNSSVPSYQPELFRSSSDFDVRNRIVFSGGWDLPFDHMWSSGPKRLTQGWSLYPIFSWRQGFPLDVFGQIFSFSSFSPGPSGAGDTGNIHANLTGQSIGAFDPHGVQTLTGPTGPHTGNFYFNPGAFTNAQCGDSNNPFPCTPVLGVGPNALFPSSAQVVADPALATYGTLPRNFFRGPGQTNLDLAFAKTTSITERFKLEIRADFFNIFNHTEFNNPSTNIFSARFGRVTTTADPRIMQLAARFTF
jgi:hypothetical protein